MLLTRNRLIREVAGFFETTNFLLLRLFLSHPKRARVLPSRFFREYVRAGGRAPWISRPLHELLPETDGARVILEYLPTGPIPMPLEELGAIGLISAALRPRTIFEIGTFRGYTALTFALNTPPDSLIYTLDLPPENRHHPMASARGHDASLIEQARPGEFLRGRAEGQKVIQLWGDSTAFNFSPYIGNMDLVFVDGAHDYEAVARDTTNALKLVSPRGIVLWHDFGQYGEYGDVTQAVLTIMPRDQVFQIENTRIAFFRREA